MRMRSSPATATWRQKLSRSGTPATWTVLTAYVNDSMNKVNDGWWDFAWTLVGRYQDGMVVGDGSGGSDGTSSYPAEWMEEVGRNQVGAAAVDASGDDYETPGYPADWMEAVGYGQTSLADKAELGIE